MSNVDEDVLLPSSVAMLKDVEYNEEKINVVETCHVQLVVDSPTKLLDTENEAEETNENNTEQKRLVTEPKNESEVVTLNEKDLTIETATIIQKVADKTLEKDNDKNSQDDKPKPKDSKPNKKTKGKQRKRKSLCCCCCRGSQPDDDDVKGHSDRNGIRVIIDNENVDEIDGGEKTIPDIKSFQQDIECTEPTRRQKCGKKCLKCCKKFLTFLFSNVGLCSAVVAYSILGGFIFQKLEAPNEIQKRHLVTSLRKGYAKDLWKLTEDRFILFENNFTYEAEKILRYYQNDVLEAKKNGWDGAESNMEVEPQWSFAGSLLYSVTVITTIGYGHIAPKTTNGRLVTIFYALFGIPLTLLCLANMGGFLGNGFRLFYKHTCRLCTWLCCPPQESFSQKKVSMPKSRSKSSQEITLLHKQEDTSGNTLSVLPPSSPKLRKISRSRSRSSSPTATGSEINIVIEDFDHRRPKPKEKKTEHIRVPIFVSLLIISLYVFGGALMFSMWEPWTYLEGSYFCFITLSTIGFGDYVPGSISRVDSADSRQKLIICCVYLMFGLSVLAMCFDLMQEDVRGKFLWLGQKMGLVDRRR